MSKEQVRLDAKDDFQKARFKATINKMLGILWPQRQELLSFEEVKSLLQPKSQAYRGLQTVEVRLVVGSEDRYRDFNKQFLPRHDHLENRWTRVDEAHLANVTLPPIKLYELGGVYFVRDGNHRVSVARLQGTEHIDAEVTSLGAEINIPPNVGIEQLSRLVIEYERRHFLSKTNFDTLFPTIPIEFTSTGQYDEVLSHIYVHKYFINQEFEEELPLVEAIKSWLYNVYQPIILMIQQEGLLLRFPGRTDADLYVWIVKHWHYLKEKYGKSVSAREAAESYSRLFGVSYRDRLRTWWRARLQAWRRFFTRGRS